MKYCSHCERVFEDSYEKCPECKGELVTIDNTMVV